MGGWRHERSRHAAQGAKREADCALRVDRVLEREHRRPTSPSLDHLVGAGEEEEAG